MPLTRPPPGLRTRLASHSVCTFSGSILKAMKLASNTCSLPQVRVPTSVPTGQAALKSSAPAMPSQPCFLSPQGMAKPEDSGDCHSAPCGDSQSRVVLACAC